jgi:hypothetical protein
MNMHVPTPMAPPPPGSTSPGDLYVDLQSRTMWLGVDMAVDPAGAVLLSDIMSIDPALDSVLLEANNYTDAQILTRAPISHTHTASQITDFTDAVSGVVGSLPGISYYRGMIIAFFGSMAEIGTGGLAGWALCDGSNGTPDMRDRFIIGAGNRAPGISNSTAKVATDTKGSHIHVIGGTALTWQQNGPHYHNVSVYGGGTFNTGTQSANHQHGTYGPWRPGGQFINHDASNDGDVGVHESVKTGATDSENASHYHAVNVAFTSTGTTDTQGSGQSHTHTCANAGDHFHEITSNALREAIPYLTLAFIMKL